MTTETIELPEVEEQQLLKPEENNYKIVRNKNDSAWKSTLQTFLPDFIHFCFPDLAKLIDWSRPYESLDSELHAITKDANQGTRIVDKLFKLYLLSGEEQTILFHTDIEGQKKKTLPKRIFTYGIRLCDRYDHPLMICVILTDQNKNWRPDRYEVSLVGTTISVKYNVIKLIDYRTRRAELEESSNPFASVILVQLAAMDAKKKSPKEQADIKFTLTRRLYEKGFSAKEIRGLYDFIDWLIALPRELEVEYLDKVYKFEEKHHMSYVSNAEMFGIEKGYIKGKQEGWQKAEIAFLTRLLTHKFKRIPEQYQQKINQADAETLLVWGEKVLDAASLEEVFI